MMDKKQMGTVGMLRVAHIYQLLGYNVLLPFGDCQKYDLVIERNGQMERIQVKTVREREGYIYVDLRVISHNMKTASAYRPTKADFDTVAVVEMNSQNVYAVPFNGETCQFHLRTRPTRNNQKKYVRMASDYLLNG